VFHFLFVCHFVYLTNRALRLGSGL
jgi:hypothetical protein